MGYDDNECFVCYAKDMGNNPSRTQGEICFTCVGGLFEDKVPSGRLLDGLQRGFMTSNGICCQCQKQTAVVCLTICSECQGGDESDTENSD
jgi:hypothetical protein